MMGFFLILTSTASALAGILLGVQVAAQSDGSAGATNGTTVPLETALPRYAVPEIFVYPLQAGNALGGYLVVRLVLPLATTAQESAEMQDETMIADAFYSTMFSMRSPASASDILPPLDKLTDAFLDAANRNAGYLRFEGAFWQQLDMFEPSTMRRKNVRDRDKEGDPVAIKPKSTH